MEIEFEITKKDYKDFHKQHHINQLKKSIAFAILVPISIGYFNVSESFELIKFLKDTFIAGLLYLIIIYVIPYFTSLLIQYSQIKKHPEYLEKKKITILEEEGIHFESTTKDEIWKWESFISLKSVNRNIVINLVSKKNILIPSSAFKSEAEFNNFLGVLQNKIVKYTGNLRDTNIKDKPPYLIGLVCLIPILGVYLGVFIIALGIFKYKDKWFTLIGLLGILFTVVLYGNLFPEIWNKDLKQKQQIGLAKRELNDLVKDIEFFKIQKGKYPVSLDEIESYSKTDVLQNDGKKSYNFNYELIGEKYKLFSSGVDKIANTKDDLYPEIEVTDSTKFGLLNSKQVSTKQSTNR